jgi:hypothetical protein
VSYIQAISKNNPEKCFILCTECIPNFKHPFKKILACALETVIIMHQLQNITERKKCGTWWDLLSPIFFFSKIQTDNKGRYSTEVRAAYIHTAAALAANVPHEKIPDLAEELDVSSRPSSGCWKLEVNKSPLGSS